MNSFEMDLKRAVCSVKFAAGVLLQLLILFQAGFASELFYISVPVVAAFPYASEWLTEYQSGFLKSYLPRSGRHSYIIGKFLACSFSGGLAEWLSCWLFQLCNKSDSKIELLLVFMSGMLWAGAAAVLAAWSGSRYIAYGGGFVLYYMLVILHERYFEEWYCLFPYEWLSPEHVWVFDRQGIVLLLSGLLLLLFCIYHTILWRDMEHV